ncbi:MAG: ABC transporter ATP-binding protein [Alphaproteobacteria bacterium]|nr:ABC transporter ATP-binding protein [Alphaproteobacteria bacterium]
MAELVLDCITKRYGGTAVVDALSLSLPSGKLLTLLGPSGCGKSTTLRIIAGLTPADSGRVHLGGRDVTALKARARNVGMVFQSLALFPHMSAADNIAFPLRVEGVSGRDRDRRVGKALDLVRMGGFARRYPDQLSGGQRQRVALARAIISNPGVLLLDEPFSALDRRLRDEMQEELRSLVGRLGITTVFVTHDQEEAIRLSDLVAVMRAGRIEQLAGPRVVYNAPRTPFVADFMGSVNFVEAEIANLAGDQVTVRLGQSAFAVPRPTDLDGAPDLGVLINVRPERVTLADTPPAAGPALAGTVTNRVFDGAFVTYTVRLSERPERSWIIRRLSSEGPATASDAVWLTWPADATQVMVSHANRSSNSR